MENTEIKGEHSKDEDIENNPHQCFGKMHSLAFFLLSYQKRTSKQKPFLGWLVYFGAFSYI
jgi:hypothetical protein